MTTQELRYELWLEAHEEVTRPLNRAGRSLRKGGPHHRAAHQDAPIKPGGMVEFALQELGAKLVRIEPLDEEG